MAKKEYSVKGILLKSIPAVLGVLLFDYSWNLYLRGLGTMTVPLILLSVLLMLVFFFFYSAKDRKETYILRYAEIKKTDLFRKVAVLLICLAAGMMLINIKLLWLYLLVIPFFIYMAMGIFSIKSVTVINPPALKNTEKAVRIDLAVFIVLIIAAFAAQYFLSSRDFKMSFILLFVIAVLMGTYFNRNQFEDLDGEEKNEKIDYILLGIVLLAAVFLRLFMIDKLPPGFDNDARVGFDFVRGNIAHKPIELFTTYVGGATSTLEHYFTYFFMKIVGFDPFIQRISESLLSLASIAFFYFLVKEMYGKKVAITAAMFYSVLFICVSMSRTDITVHRTMLYTNMGLLFLIKGIKNGSTFMLMLSGLMTGISFYAYHSSKMYIFLAAVMFIVYAVNLSKIKSNYKNLLSFVFILTVALILFMPLLNIMIASRDQFFSYSKEFAVKGRGLQLLNDLLGQFMTVLYSFTVKGSEHFLTVLPGRPLLAGFQKILFVLGIAYLFYAFKRRANLTTVFWLLLGIFPIVYFPYKFQLYYYRMILVFPALAIVLALGFNVIYRYLSGAFKNHKKYIYVVMFAGAFIFSFADTYNDYFNKFASNGSIRDRYDNVNFQIEKKIKQYSKKSRVYLSEYYIKDGGSFFFGQMAVNRKVQRLFEVVNVFAVKPSDFYGAEKDVTIIAEGLSAEYFEHFKEYYPNIEIYSEPNVYKQERLVDPAAPENLYTVVTIPLNDIKNAYGLNVKTKKGGVIEESRYLGEPVIYSCDSVELYGLIDLPENTSYVFDVGQNQKTAVFIDGAGYWGKRLPKGLHRIRIKLSGNINMNLQVFWKYKGKRSPVDAKYLLMAKELYGIRADYMYFINQKDNFSAIEPVMISRVYWFNTEMKTEGKEGSYTILWSGYFNAGQEGEYTFNLESYKGFCSSILVNEYKCADYSGGETVVKSIRLAEGWHKIELKTYSYIDIPDASAFYYKLKVKKPEDDDFITVKYNEFKPYKPQ